MKRYSYQHRLLAVICLSACLLLGAHLSLFPANFQISSTNDSNPNGISKIRNSKDVSFLNVPVNCFEISCNKTRILNRLEGVTLPAWIGVNVSDDGTTGHRNETYDLINYSTVATINPFYPADSSVIELSQQQFNEPIDAIITFVNGSDPGFLYDLVRYRSESGVLNAANTARYRDHDELRFLLRSIEKFASFFRYIHLVVACETQVPVWLNKAHSKLKVWYHRQIFLNISHLPTFSSLAIEANFHRIPELADLAVYFNDDFMLVNRISPQSFYELENHSESRRNSSLTEVQLNTSNRTGAGSPHLNQLLKNFKLRNDFQFHVPWRPRKASHKEAFWINSGIFAAQALELVCNDTSSISGFRRWHLHTPYVFMKSVVSEAEHYPAIAAVLHSVSAHRFRCMDCVSTVLLHHWLAQCSLGVKAVQAPARRGRLNVKVDAVGSGHLDQIKHQLNTIQDAIAAKSIDFLIINDEAIGNTTPIGRSVDEAVNKWRSLFLPAQSKFENKY